MPFDQFNCWEPLPKTQWLPNASAVFCQVMDKVTQQRCTARLHWGNRHHCRECGILICSKHSYNQYYGYKVCDMCYSTLNSMNRWKPLSETQWLPNASATFCQVMDKVTQQRCTARLYWGNRHHCRECGILVCSYHSSHRYQGYRVCDPCYPYLLKAYRTSFIKISNKKWRKVAEEIDKFFLQKTNLLRSSAIFIKNLFIDQEEIINNIITKNNFKKNEAEDYIILHNIHQVMKRYTKIPKLLLIQQSRIYFLESEERWPHSRVINYWNSLNL